MNKKLVTLLLPAVFVLGGCSTAYQKSSLVTNGYSEMRLSEDSYIVEYESNKYTKPNTNYRHALRRAAELTKQNGFQYFEITNVNDNNSSNKSQIVVQSKKDFTIINGNKIIKPAVQMTIKMSDVKTEDAYQANAVLSNFESAS